MNKHTWKCVHYRNTCGIKLCQHEEGWVQGSPIFHRQEKNVNGGCRAWHEDLQVGPSFGGEFTVKNQQEAFVGVCRFLGVLQVPLYQHFSCVNVVGILQKEHGTWHQESLSDVWYACQVYPALLVHSDQWCSLVALS